MIATFEDNVRTGIRIRATPVWTAAHRVFLSLVPTDEEVRYAVELMIVSETEGVVIYSTVEGLASAYALQDDLGDEIHATLDARRVGDRRRWRWRAIGDTSIRDWCNEYIPDLTRRACSLAVGERPPAPR